jgi:hypothetical protein
MELSPKVYTWLCGLFASVFFLKKCAFISANDPPIRSWEYYIRL